MIAGPNVYICDECIDLCTDIIERECEREEGRGETPPPSEALAISAVCIVCRLPKPMEEVLAVPHRGFICATCVESIRSAADERGKG
jgi:ClpX C4-type zinc finger